MGEKIIAFPEGLEPSCYHTATSERRRIRLKADYYYIALRGASIRRSQCGNSEAIVGVAVRASRHYLVNKSVGVITNCTDSCFCNGFSSSCVGNLEIRDFEL